MKVNVDMKEKKFNLNFIAYFATVIAWIIPIWAIIFLVNNSPTPMNLTKNWLSLLLIFGALVSPSLIVTWSFIVEMTTSFSADGINRLTFFGKKQINWSEIESLQTGIFYIEFRLSTKLYRIPLLMYKNPNGLANYVREQFTTHFIKH